MRQHPSVRLLAHPTWRHELSVLLLRRLEFINTCYENPQKKKPPAWISSVIPEFSVSCNWWLTSIHLCGLHLSLDDLQVTWLPLMCIGKSCSCLLNIKVWSCFECRSSGVMRFSQASMKLKSPLKFLSILLSSTELKSHQFHKWISEIIGGMMERWTINHIIWVYLIRQNWTKFLVQCPTGFEIIYEMELNRFIQ